MLMKSYPVTRWLILFNIIVPLLCNIIVPGFQNFFSIKSAAPYITEYHQYYRYVTFQLFSSGLESDICLIVILLYTFRPLERAMGKAQYTAVIAGLIFYNMLITGVLVHYGLVVDVFLQKLKFKEKYGYAFNDEYGIGLPSGLTCCIVGLFHLYKKYVPSKFTFAFQLRSRAKPEQAETSMSGGRVLGTNESQDLGSTAQSKLQASDDDLERVQLNNTLNASQSQGIVLGDQFFVNIMFLLLLLNNSQSILFFVISWGISILFDIGFLPGKKFKIPDYLLFNNDRRNYTMLSSYNSIMSRNNGNQHPVTPFSNSRDDDDEDDDEDEENTEPVRPLAVQIMNTFHS
ncbi:hypothetical protein ACO0QE_000328 [Hanseniaspora vineae]